VPTPFPSLNFPPSQSSTTLALYKLCLVPFSFSVTVDSFEILFPIYPKHPCIFPQSHVEPLRFPFFGVSPKSFSLPSPQIATTICTKTSGLHPPPFHPPSDRPSHPFSPPPLDAIDFFLKQSKCPPPTSEDPPFSVSCCRKGRDHFLAAKSSPDASPLTFTFWYDLL